MDGEFGKNIWWIKIPLKTNAISALGVKVPKTWGKTWTAKSFVRPTTRFEHL